MSFELSVQFGGLCIYAHDATTGQLGIVMPDARRTGPCSNDPDGRACQPAHAGYLRFNLADLSGRWAGKGADIPNFEVVYRFARQALRFCVEPSSVNITASFPDLGQFASGLELTPGLFGHSRSKELLMRTVLSGGEFASITTDIQGSWYIDKRLAGARLDHYTGGFANYATWTRTIDAEAIVLQLESFQGDVQDELRLSPADGKSVAIKIANLCAHNPLEWSELEARMVEGGKSDEDFRWLYHLVEPAGGVPWKNFLADLNVKTLPVPQSDGRKDKVPFLLENCFGLETHAKNLFRL